MIEFIIVGPIVTLLGLAMLQYGLMFFAKNQLNHASFMAARSGSTGNADIDTIREGFVRAMVPMYGGGRNVVELTESYARALVDTGVFSKLELLNPTRESFDDWNDAYLQQTVGRGSRVIPNSGQWMRDMNAVGGRSGQTIQDANLIKLRIMYGYEPKVPLIGPLYTSALRLADRGNDAFYTTLVAAGRIPLLTHATVQMQSDAIEKGAVSAPGAGSGGSAGNGGSTGNPGGSTGTGGGQGGGGTGGEGGGYSTAPGQGSVFTDIIGGGCRGSNCPVCQGS